MGSESYLLKSCERGNKKLTKRRNWKVKLHLFTNVLNVCKDVRVLFYGICMVQYDIPLIRYDTYFSLPLVFCRKNYQEKVWYFIKTQIIPNPTPAIKLLQLNIITNEMKLRIWFRSILCFGATFDEWNELNTL